MASKVYPKPYLVRLAKVVKELQRECIELINDTKSLLETVEENGSDMVTEFIKKYISLQTGEDVCTPTKDEARTILASALTDIAKDASSVADEIELFEELLIKNGEESIRERHSEVKLLSGVWFGDVYDADRLEGMKALKDEIAKVVQEIDEEYVVDYALKMGNSAVEILV